MGVQALTVVAARAPPELINPDAEEIGAKVLVDTALIVVPQTEVKPTEESSWCQIPRTSASLASAYGLPPEDCWLAKKKKKGEARGNFGGGSQRF